MRFSSATRITLAVATGLALAASAVGQDQPEWVWQVAGHTGNVESVDYSPNGARLAVGDSGDTVRVWDTSSGALVLTIKGHERAVNAVAYSPNGATIATGSDEVIRLWDASTGALIRTFVGHTGDVESLAFSPNGTNLASAGGLSDETVKIWNVSTGATIRTLSGHTEGVYSVAYSPDGATLLSGSFDDTVRVWNPTTGVLRRILTDHTSSVRAVAFSRDGSRFATSANDQTIRIYTGSTLFLERTLTSPETSASCLSFGSDNVSLASGHGGQFGDSVIRVWNVTTGALVLTLTGHENRVVSLDYSPNGASIASGSIDGTARLWRSSTGVLTRILGLVPSVMGDMAFSPDGASLAVDGFIDAHRLSAATGAYGIEYPTAEFIRAFAYAPNGSILAVALNNTTTKLFSPSTGALLATLSGHTGDPTDVAFAADGSTLATSSFDGTAKVWNPQTGAVIRTLIHPAAVNCVAYSPNYGYLATGDQGDTVRIWNPATGELVQTLPLLAGSVDDVAFSPDGRLFAASDDNAVTVYETRNFTTVRTIPLEEFASKVDFSTDGLTLAIADAGNVNGSLLKLVNPYSGAVLRTYDFVRDSLENVDFSPDGQRLALANRFSGVALNPITRWIPNAFRVRLGRLDAGNLSSLAADDAVGLRVCKFIVPNQIVDPVNVEVEATSTEASPVSLEVAFRGRMRTSGGFRIAVELWDFTDSTWTNRFEVAVGTPYVTHGVTAAGPISRFFGPNGTLRARYLVRPTGPTGTSVWCHDMDLFVFRTAR